MKRRYRAPGAAPHPGGAALAQALLASDSAYDRDARLFRRRDAVRRAASSGVASTSSRVLGGVRDNADPLKDDPFDVPVWRPSEGDPAGRPVGLGRPGWHAGVPPWP